MRMHQKLHSPNSTIPFSSSTGVITPLVAINSLRRSRSVLPDSHELGLTLRSTKITISQTIGACSREESPHEARHHCPWLGHPWSSGARHSPRHFRNDNVHYGHARRCCSRLLRSDLAKLKT